MTERFTGLDEFFLHIEAPHRSAHWAVVVDLRESATPAGRPNETPLTETALRTRVAERVARYPVFRLGARDGVRGHPTMHQYDVASALSCVESTEVANEAGFRRALSQLLARPMTRDRPAWRMILVNQRDAGVQRLILLGHHSISDGVAAAGYAALLIDGDDDQLAALDRYLVSDRYVGPNLTLRQSSSGTRAFVRSWWRASRSPRLPRLTTGARRATYTIEIPTGAVRAVAVEHGVGTGELLVSAVGAALADVAAGALPTPPRKLRAFLPATLDDEFRHRGNAASVVLIDFECASLDFTERVATTRRRLAGSFDTDARLALPAAARLSGGLPRGIRRHAARATLSVLAPDVHVGVNPGYVNLRTVLGRRIAGVRALSPLLGNPISFTCTILGRTVHIGIVWDPGAIGETFGYQAAQRITDYIDPTGASTSPDAPTASLAPIATNQGG